MIVPAGSDILYRVANSWGPSRGNARYFLRESDVLGGRNTIYRSDWQDFCTFGRREVADKKHRIFLACFYTLTG